MKVAFPFRPFEVRRALNAQRSITERRRRIAGYSATFRSDAAPAGVGRK